MLERRLCEGYARRGGGAEEAAAVGRGEEGERDPELETSG
jgi:hypothetical protein